VAMDWFRGEGDGPTTRGEGRGGGPTVVVGVTMLREGVVLTEPPVPEAVEGPRGLTATESE